MRPPSRTQFKPVECTGAGLRVVDTAAHYNCTAAIKGLSKGIKHTWLRVQTALTYCSHILLSRSVLTFCPHILYVPHSPGWLCDSPMRSMAADASTPASGPAADTSHSTSRSCHTRDKDRRHEVRIHDDMMMR